MDSRLKKLSILGCLAIAVLIAVVVAAANGKLGKGSTSSQNAEVSAENVETAEDGNVQKASGQVGDNLKAFEDDLTFFDSDENTSSVLLGDDAIALHLQVTSVYKDLRVLVLDNDNKTVSGNEFSVRLTDPEGETSDVSDIDEDGVIYVGDLGSGNYDVYLLPISGFLMPQNSTACYVKEQVEYVPIEDVEVLIKSEEQSDTVKDDKMNTDAEITSDGTENRAIVLGGVRQKAGTDVSSRNGEIDWKKVSDAGLGFAIIRAGYRGASTGNLIEDSEFEENIRKARENGLMVGAYFYSQAITEEEAVEEASAAIEIVREQELDLPIYFMIASAGGRGRADSLSASERTLIAEAFCRTLSNAGYQAGIYGSCEWLEEHVEFTKLSKYDCWLSQFTAVPTFSDYYTIWQYTSKGEIDGIDGESNLDIYYY